MTSDDFYFRMLGDRTEYRMSLWDNAPKCRVYWWDCGWEYHTDYDSDFVLKMVQTGEWVLVDGK